MSCIDTCEPYILVMQCPVFTYAVPTHPLCNILCCLMPGWYCLHLLYTPRGYRLRAPAVILRYEVLAYHMAVPESS